MEALETDPDFRKKLNDASEDDIRSGNIAHELEYVNHQVRTKLDEIKREEIERLRALVKKQVGLSPNENVLTNFITHFNYNFSVSIEQSHR